MRIFLSLLAGTMLVALVPLAGQSLSGRRAPSFSLPDSNQVQHDILDYRGKWLLLDFTKTTTCPHCVELSKELGQVKAQLGPKINVLSIVLSPPENANTVAHYVMENKVAWPVVFDQSQVAIAYFKATPSRPGIDTPHLFAISPTGSIVRDWSDAAIATDFLATKGALLKQVQELMASAGRARTTSKSAAKK